MKYYILSGITLFGLLLLSCNGGQSITEKKETSLNESMAGKYLVVSFISKGSGIDRDALSCFQDKLKNELASLTFEKRPWGKEGEIDYCLDISSKDSGDIQNARVLIDECIGNSEEVKVLEKEEC